MSPREVAAIAFVAGLLFVPVGRRVGSLLVRVARWRFEAWMREAEKDPYFNREYARPKRDPR